MFRMKNKEMTLSVIWPYRYALVEETIETEGFSYVGYGILLVDKESSCLKFHSDISSDREAVESLVHRCNALFLDPIHFENVVEDFLI